VNGSLPFRNKFLGLKSGMGQSLPGRVRSNSGHVRYAPLPVTCLCEFMATHTTSFPRSSLLKGGTVPRQQI